MKLRASTLLVMAEQDETDLFAPDPSSRYLSVYAGLYATDRSLYS